MGNTLPPTINLHFWKACNYRCSFCFATFNDSSELERIRGSGLSKDDWVRLIRLVREAGVDKINFVGGEPTLAPYLGELLTVSRDVGLTTSIVTNGERLDALLQTHAKYINWVGLSVDSSSEEVERRLGRGKGGHVERSLRQFESLRCLGIRTKLNTTVTSLSWEEDMSDFVLKARPERWKVFQVLSVEGQNDDGIGALLVSDEQFQQYVQRHAHLEAKGITIADETNEDMTGSYAMVDPLGRFFSNVGGKHTYSRAILDVGVREAFDDVSFSRDRFRDRGGEYEWRTIPLTVSAAARSAP